MATIGALAGVLVLLNVPLGLASTESFSDPRDDLDPPAASNAADYDIVRATEGHSNGRLVHTVSVAGNIANPASAQVPWLYVEDTRSDRPNGTATCRYFVGRFEGRLGVFTCGYGDREAGARIRRTSSRTVRYEFTPRAIGSPASYRWAFVTEGPTDGTRSLVDRLPSGDNVFLTHKLR